MLEDRVTLEDLRITSASLRQQAEIARAAGRDTLAANFERDAEFVDVPQDTIMRIYELLRPCRAQSPRELLAAAREPRPIWSQGHRGVRRRGRRSLRTRGLFKKRF